MGKLLLSSARLVSLSDVLALMVLRTARLHSLQIKSRARDIGDGVGAGEEKLVYISRGGRVIDADSSWCSTNLTAEHIRLRCR
jgi:hypothetical protein